eukprot:9987069-Alexandrium_andersonii.AAC.1
MRRGIAARACAAGLRRPRPGPRDRRGPGALPLTKRQPRRVWEGSAASRVCAGALRRGAGAYRAGAA